MNHKNTAQKPRLEHCITAEESAEAPGEKERRSNNYNLSMSDEGNGGNKVDDVWASLQAEESEKNREYKKRVKVGLWPLF